MLKQSKAFNIIDDHIWRLGVQALGVQVSCILENVRSLRTRTRTHTVGVPCARMVWYSSQSESYYLC